MANFISYLKNLFYTLFLFGIFGVIIFGFNNGCEIKKEADRYDSLNQRNKRINEGDGLQPKSVQDSTGVNSYIRYDSSNNNN